MNVIYNPILLGFNPDPSIVRVGPDYYIAASTFEWFPGVQIHHSCDLVHRRLIAHPLNRISQLAIRPHAAFRLDPMKNRIFHQWLQGKFDNQIS
jgi:beta-xylosidase